MSSLTCVFVYFVQAVHFTLWGILLYNVWVVLRECYGVINLQETINLLVKSLHSDAQAFGTIFETGDHLFSLNGVVTTSREEIWTDGDICVAKKQQRVWWKLLCA